MFQSQDDCFPSAKPSQARLWGRGKVLRVVFLGSQLFLIHYYRTLLIAIYLLQRRFAREWNIVIVYASPTRYSHNKRARQQLFPFRVRSEVMVQRKCPKVGTVSVVRWWWWGIFRVYVIHLRYDWPPKRGTSVSVMRFGEKPAYH